MPINPWELLSGKCYINSKCKHPLIKVSGYLINDKNELEKFDIPYCQTCDAFLLSKAQHKQNYLRFSVIKPAVKPKSNLSFKDTLIRCNTFICTNKSHKIENIKCHVSIMDENGDIESLPVIAGFCSICNLYYLTEDDYSKLKKKGVILCKIRSKGQVLNEQSILRQYGYYVGSNNELSTKQRRRILCMIYDYGILSYVEIVHYLDFFINQHRRHPNAVRKWKEDKNYMLQYARRKLK